jgi:hypothetical protein
MLQHRPLHCETWGVPLTFGEDIKTLVFSFFFGVCAWVSSFSPTRLSSLFFCFLLFLVTVVEGIEHPNYLSQTSYLKPSRMVLY